MSSDAQIELEDFLIQLQGAEGFDFEAKEAYNGIPRSIWATVSAFANTDGGLIVLGLGETADGWKIGGVQHPEQMKLDLHTAFRNPHKVSQEVAGHQDIWIETLYGKPLIVIRVRAVPRAQRPVYIEHDRNLAYVRRDSGDFRCTDEELDRLRREASHEPFDGRVIPFLDVGDFDLATVARYRERLNEEHPGLPMLRFETREFLEAIGAWRQDRDRDQEGPTFAGMLMFGTEIAIREVRPVHVIDYRRVPGDQTARRRWTDRVRWTGNLFGAWEEIFPRLTRGLPVPFKLNDVQRIDRQAGRETLREAFVNLLIHTDYQESSDAVILHMDDGYSFQNPGDSRLSRASFFRPGRSERRNPTIAQLFHLAGLSDQAGSGFVRIFDEWRELGYRAPTIRTGEGAYAFELELRLTSLISFQDRQWLAEIGSNWNEAEELALIFARHDGMVDNQTLRNATGKELLETSRVLSRLRDRGFLIMHAAGRNTLYELGPKALSQPASAGLDALSLRTNGASLRTKGSDLPPMESSLPPGGANLPRKGMSLPLKEQVPSPRTVEISAEAWQALGLIGEPIRSRPRVTAELRDNTIVQLCAIAPLTAREIESLIGRQLKVVRRILLQMIDQGRIFYVYPDRPNHPNQRYTSQRIPGTRGEIEEQN